MMMARVTRNGWETWYARKIAEAWASLPKVVMRLRGKLGDDGRYHTTPVVEVTLTVDDAEMLCNGHMPDVELVGRLRETVRAARKLEW